MKILLCASNYCIDPYPVYPIGLSVIAKALSDEGYMVVQFDPNIYPKANRIEELVKLLQLNSFDLVGISIRNLATLDFKSVEDTCLKDSLELIEVVRKNSKAEIFLGGSGFSLYAQEILKLSGVKYGIAGEGEEAVKELVGKFSRGEKPEEGVFTQNVSQQSGMILDSTIAQYYYNETHILPMQTKRGCSQNCLYCTYPALEGRNIRSRSLDCVVDEIEKIQEQYPEVLLYFVDAVFNDDQRYFEELLKRIIARRINIKWTGFITPGNLQDGDIELMSSSGMISADLGIDASTDETLRGIGKNFTFETAWRAAHKMRELQIGVTSSIMIGGPAETYETIRQGIKNIKSLEPNFTMIFAGIRVLRNTPLLQLMKNQSLVASDWDELEPLYYFAKNLDAQKVHEILLEEFKDNRYSMYPGDKSSEQLRQLHKFGYRKLKAQL